MLSELTVYDYSRTFHGWRIVINFFKFILNFETEAVGAFYMPELWRLWINSLKEKTAFSLRSISLFYSFFLSVSLYLSVSLGSKDTKHIITPHKCRFFCFFIIAENPTTIDSK